jgi:NAD(P)-dependent dehydrogenase (short-subunit alcohol dehydrogenase family)
VALEELFGLQDRVMLVVGASSGLGAQCALAFARAGAKVALVARRRDKLEAQERELRALGANTLVVEADATKDEDVARAFDQVEAGLGPIYGVLNAAGLARLGRAERHKRQSWDASIAVNLTAAFVISQQAGTRMIARQAGGRIIHISSVLGRGANPVHRNVGYVAAKGGVDNLVRQLAVEWASHGITVNAIAPGFFPTEMTVDPAHGTMDAQMEATIRARTPMGRTGEVREIETAALFLAAPASSYVTGISLAVDGGWTAW